MSEMVFAGVAALGRRARGLVYAAAASAALALALAPSPALAGPDAAKVRTAAEEFDEAVRLYKQKDYGAAASHFEAADAAVPNPKALRLAIKSRAEAGQAARAATLSAYAIENYPSDAETVSVAKETLAKLKPSLQEVKVSCASPCILAVSTGGEPPRSVHGSANTRWTLFVPTGSSVVSASFLGNLPGGEKPVEGVAGKSADLRFEPTGSKPAEPPPVVAPVAPSDPKEPPSDTSTPPEEADGGGLSPIFFISAAVLTAGAGGVLVWSGIDTLENPGEDAVRAGCAGQGTECPLYQQGLDAELRTNVLIGVTAGLAATTLVFAILTDWDGSPDAAAEVGGLRLGRPGALVSERGGAVSLGGRF
jgi:hypothetical protein